MQAYKIENDVPLFGVQAASFPGGIQKAWSDLYEKLSNTKGRNFYGLSHGTAGGGVVYNACVEEAFAGEAESLGCERFLLPKGEYTGETIRDYKHRVSRIGETFQTLLARNDYDNVNGQCVEQYRNDKDVVCLIRKAVQTN